MEEITIIRSARKTVSLEVNKKGEILVRAPFFVPEKTLMNFVRDKEAWILRAKEKVSALPKQKDFSDAEIEELRENTRAVVNQKALLWSERIGVHYGKIRITSARHRFGSCSAKGDLSFSLFLSLYPDRLIDYVVVHELCHTVHHNHSRDFYRFLSSVLPDYKNREEALKKMPLP